jgi:hypothetical protein
MYQWTADWFDGDDYSKTTNRLNANPALKVKAIGFRCAIPAAP